MLIHIGFSLSNEPNKRNSGFENDCLLRGLKYEEKILNNSNSLEIIQRFSERKIKKIRLKFDGIFCFTDLIVHDIIKQLESLKIKIPNDVQIIGFYGILMFCSNEYICFVQQITETCVNLLLKDSPIFSPLSVSAYMPARSL